MPKMKVQACKSFSGDLKKVDEDLNSFLFDKKLDYRRFLAASQSEYVDSKGKSVITKTIYYESMEEVEVKEKKAE